MRVRIDAGGCTVEIECPDANVSPKELAEQARSLWEATEGATKPREGPAYGYTPSSPVTPLAPYPLLEPGISRGVPVPVRAEETT